MEWLCALLLFLDRKYDLHRFTYIVTNAHVLGSAKLGYTLVFEVFISG